MRLSDAIGLGRTLVRVHRAGDIRGCALGMSFLAIGGNPADVGPNFESIKAEWPWLKERRFDPLYSPNNSSANFIAYCKSVWLRFDDLVMGGGMTLDQLIDWVRSVEPPEPDAPQISTEVNQPTQEAVTSDTNGGSRNE